MGPSVEWRDDGVQLGPDLSLDILRFESADLAMVIKNACGASVHYGLDLLARAGYGSEERIIPLSCFAETTLWTPEELAKGTSYKQFRRVRASVLQPHFAILPTSVYQDGQPDPRNEVHFDVVVLAGPGLPPAGLNGNRSERAAARDALRPHFQRVLELCGKPVDL